jgi:leader peptidase (prepilin peptidase)/N-methyltransferase
MIYALIFVFGAVIGSFLNVVVLRYGTGESILRGKSRCFSCGKDLVWYELIPILSFFIQKRRCRVCGAKISWQYLTVEVMTGVLFLLIFHQVSVPQFSKLFYLWTIVSLLIVVAVYDFRHKIVPNKIVWLFNGLVFGYLVLEFVLKFKIENLKLAVDLLGGFCFSAFFAFSWLVSRGRWMGLGDAKLALGLGWFLGFPKTALAFLFSFWLGAIFSILLLFFQGVNIQ